jgi:hypothetical protein
MSVDFYLPNIQFENITIRPIMFFIVADNNNRPVFLYELSNGSERCTIPYYMSDGKTNSFRANMLLPFLCINQNAEDDSCPFSFVSKSEGIIYKYKSCEDFKADEINNMLSIHTFGIDFISNTEYNTLNTRLIYEGSDLLSVFVRLKTFLNFILAISSYKFKYGLDNSTYLNEKYFIPSDRRDYNIQQYDINFTIELPKSKFRETMIKFCSDIYNVITKLIKIDYIQKNISELTIIPSSELNKQIYICSNNKIDDSFKLNNKTYNDICKEFSNKYKLQKFILYYLILSEPNIICNEVENSFSDFQLTCVPTQIIALRTDQTEVSMPPYMNESHYGPLFELLRPYYDVRHYGMYITRDESDAKNRKFRKSKLM